MICTHESIDWKAYPPQCRDCYKSLNGEEKFFAVDQIYTKYRFHPIQNMMTGLSFFVILPVLISAYLLLCVNRTSTPISGFII